MVTLLFSLSTYSQFKVSGKIVNAKNEPIEFATVTLQQMSDSSKVRGVITKSDGVFEFLNLSSARYRLTAQALGYQDFVEQIDVESNFQIATIEMVEDVYLLEEVQVIAKRSVLENRLGKKILRIGEDLSTTGSTAVEAMERIPSVTTTQQGNIQIRGSSNIVVYINGKETARNASSLRFIPAEVLEKIEVITTPSAKYDAEGVAGIINLVYRKNRIKDFKLDVIANTSVPPRITGGLNLSLNLNKFSFYTNISGTTSISESTSITERTNSEGSIELYENRIINTGFQTGRNLDIGVTYQPDSTFTVDLEINYNRFKDDSNADRFNRFKIRTISDEELFRSQSKSEDLEDEAALSLSMGKEFAPNRKLKILLSAGGEDEDNFSRYEEFSAESIPEEIQQFLLLSDELESQRLYQGKIDYESPFFKFGTFETGIKIDYIQYDIFQAVEFQNDTLTIPNNDFSITQKKYAAYFLHKNTFDRLEYAIGLRLEAFKSNGIQRSTSETFEQDNTKIFPSLQLQYNFEGKSHTIGFSYTKRINRPGFFDVNPYVSFSDPLNLQTGNPDLDPEIANLFELNYHLKLGVLDTDLTVYRRQTENVIQATISFIDGNQTIQTLTNFEERTDKGIEAQIEFNNDGIFSTYGTITVSRSAFKDINTPSQFNNTTAWGLRLSQQIKLKKNWIFDLSETYRAPRFEPQRKFKSQFFIDFNVSKKFGNNKGSITLNFRDIFNNRIFANEVRGSNFLIDRSFKFQTQRITLGLQYTVFD